MHKLNDRISQGGSNELILYGNSFVLSLIGLTKKKKDGDFSIGLTHFQKEIVSDNPLTQSDVENDFKW